MKVITGFHSIEERVNVLEKEFQKSHKVSPNAADLKIFFSKPGPRIKKILETAKKAGVTAQKVSDAELDKMVSDLPETLRDHRGIVMTVSGAGANQEQANLVDLDEWISLNSTGPSAAETSSQAAALTVVVLDRVTDPHNVGAIIRSCDQFGVSLVIIPEHNSANDIAGNEVIGRTSAGASAWVPVAVVNNLVRAVEKLKAVGFWVYGADAGGETLGQIEFAPKSVIVMGSEGTGIAQLLEKQCDTIVSIPTCGKIDSLNVSVAAGVLLYEVYRRRR